MALHLVLLSTILAFSLASTEQGVSSPPPTTNTTSTTTPKSCPHSGYQLFAEFNCYKAFPSRDEKKPWIEAREQCMRDGGDLMVMETEREREDVYIPLYNSLRFSDYPWVGVYIPPGGNNWTSVKGEPALSAWWESGNPVKNAAFNCVFADYSGLMWNWNCANSLPFICEIGI